MVIQILFACKKQKLLILKFNVHALLFDKVAQCLLSIMTMEEEDLSFFLLPYAKGILCIGEIPIQSCSVDFT